MERHKWRQEWLLPVGLNLQIWYSITMGGHQVIGQDLLVWWYFFAFSAIIASSSGVLSVISIVLPSVCCWVLKVVPDLLNLPSIYLIRQARVRSSSPSWILCIWMDGGPLTESARALTRLVWYSMIRAPSWLFVTLIPKYVDWSPFVISTSLSSDVTCGNCRYIWVSCRPF